MKTIEQFYELVSDIVKYWKVCNTCNDHTRPKTYAYLWNRQDVNAVNLAKISLDKYNVYFYSDGWNSQSDFAIQYPAVFVFMETETLSNVFKNKKDKTRSLIQITVADQDIESKETGYDNRLKGTIYEDCKKIMINLLHQIGKAKEYTDGTKEYYRFRTTDLPENFELTGDESFNDNLRRLNDSITIEPMDYGSAKLIGCTVNLNVESQFCVDVNEC